LMDVWKRLLASFNARIEAAFSPQGLLARGPLTGGMAVWAGVLLGGVLLMSFLAST